MHKISYVVVYKCQIDVTLILYNGDNLIQNLFKFPILLLHLNSSFLTYFIQAFYVTNYFMRKSPKKPIFHLSFTHFYSHISSTSNSWLTHHICLTAYLTSVQTLIQLLEGKLMSRINSSFGELIQ